MRTRFVGYLSFTRDVSSLSVGNHDVRISAVDLNGSHGSALVTYTVKGIVKSFMNLQISVIALNDSFLFGLCRRFESKLPK